MRKRSKLIDMKRRRLVEDARRMTPDERLAAYVEHSRLVMEIRRAGEAHRASSRPPRQ